MGLELMRQALRNRDRRLTGEAKRVYVLLAFLADDVTGRGDLSRRPSAEELAAFEAEMRRHEAFWRPSAEELAEYHAEMRRFEQGSRRHGL